MLGLLVFRDFEGFLQGFITGLGFQGLGFSILGFRVSGLIILGFRVFSLWRFRISGFGQCHERSSFTLRKFRILRAPVDPKIPKTSSH